MNQKEIGERPFFDNTEALFSEFIEDYGGVVVERLPNYDTGKQNADYIFDSPNIVAELKTFEKDVFGGKEDAPRLSKLMSKWIENGVLDYDLILESVVNGTSLPKVCLQEMVSIASKTIERAMHKANKQIQETKVTFEKQNADGILFLINDGNYFFNTQGFISVICNLIERKFKEASFNVVVFITINQTTRRDQSDLDYNIWIPIYTKVDENGETIISNELYRLINDLGSKFLEDFLARKTGIKSRDSRKIDDLEEGIRELRKHKYIPKEIIYKKRQRE